MSAARPGPELGPRICSQAGPARATPAGPSRAPPWALMVRGRRRGGRADGPADLGRGAQACPAAPRARRRGAARPPVRARRARGAGERPEPPAGGRSAACGPGTPGDSAVSSMWWTLQARAAGVVARSGASRSAFGELGRVVLVGCAREAAWRSGPPRRLVPPGGPSSRGAPSPDGFSVLCSWGRGTCWWRPTACGFFQPDLSWVTCRYHPPPFFKRTFYHGNF